MDDITKYKLRVTFTEPLLGSAPLNADVYSTYIASKAPAAAASNGTTLAELETLVDGDKGRTGFHRLEDGTPILYDYVFRGFFKEACGALRQQRNRQSAALKAYKTKIDAHLFVFPRHIPLRVTRPQEVGVLERPLRADTMQGPRVALAASEMLPAQTWLECQLHVLAPEIITEALLREWLEYGKYLGLGQWRSGSWGRFEFRLTEFR